MLDKAENPEKMVKLMISEMEDSLVEVKSQAAKIISEKKYLERQIEFLEGQEKKWHENAELAVAKSRDDLARSALEEKAKQVALKEEVKDQLAKMDTTLQKLRTDIGMLEAKLVEAKSRQKSIVIRKRAAESRLDIKKNIHLADSNNAFLKFEEYENAIDKLEGKVESYELGLKSNRSLDDEFSRLQQQERIEDELSQIKESLTKKPGKLEKPAKQGGV